MNIPQLLHKLPMVADIEVVVSLLPEMLVFSNESARDSLFQRFNCVRKCFPLRFTQKQMHMLRHDNISVHAQIVAAPDTFQCHFEGLPVDIRYEQMPTFIAAECNEVGLS